jgi:hypothetical protein
MTDPIFKITDGTIEIDLLNDVYGLSLESWRQQIINFKNGGTYRDNPLADQRRLVDTKFTNAIETLTVKDKEVTADTLIEATQNLLRMLEKAVSYWTTDWQNTPVYLVARAACETNARYALIVNYRLPDLPSPYEQPFIQTGDDRLWDNYDIILEREHWTKNAPGTGSAIPISAVETYDGRELGNVDDAGDRDPLTSGVFISNKRNEANLSDVYISDGGVFGGNLLDTALPYDLLPAVPAVNDAVYFGIDSTLGDSGPFDNIIFDISVAQIDLTVIWEYWNGAAWAALTVQDNTNDNGDMAGQAFDTTGINGVYWIQPSDWTTTTVNVVVALWVRARVSAIGAAPAPPRQQLRNVYSTIWPYVEFQSADIGGDIPALGQIKMKNRTGRAGALKAYAADDFIIGSRSVSRGSAFTAIINAADEQNPTGITVTAGVNSLIVGDTSTPTARRVTYNPVATGDDLESIVRFDFDDSINPDFFGSYRAFLRCQQPSGSVGDISFRYRTRILGDSAITIEDGDLVTIDATGEVRAVDMGTLDIPGNSNLLTSDIITEFRIMILSTVDDATPDLYIYDLILIPTDEWSGQFVSNTSIFFDWTQYIDSVENPKTNIRSFATDSADTVAGFSSVRSNGSVVLNPNSNFRLWFISLSQSSGSDDEWGINHEIEITANQRYLSHRGAR